jgi:AraC-like DNA-binding protein
MEPGNRRLRELRDLVLRHASNCALNQALPHVVLMTSSVPTHPKPVIAEPVFVLVAQGAKQAMLPRQTYHYHAGQYLIVSVDLPLHGCVVRASKVEPYLAVGMLLKAEAIASLLLEAGIPPVPKSEEAGIAVSDATEDIVAPVIRLLRLLDRPSDIPVLRDSIEREILWRLINGDQGHLLRQLGLADSRASQIGRAIKWLRAHYRDPLRIETLTDLVGMSPTSFHRHFRCVTSMSPLQYQKQLRLHEARARLLSGNEDVATIGYTVGYESPSQFNREYKRFFGVPPGQDAERLRSMDKPVETVSPNTYQSLHLT